MRAFVGFSAALLLGGASHASSAQLIVFAADRTPSISGDVYRADGNGHVVDLTHSPWQETQPLVSPNGKLIAFTSDRFGGSLWTIAIDGTGLRRVSAIGFPTEQYVQMAWSSDSTTIALTSGTVSGPALSLATPGGRPRVLARGRALGAVWWSPDGRLVTVHTEGSIDAYTLAGKKAWSVTSGPNAYGWSQLGLFATGAYDGRVHVVDESGRERFSVAANSASWSADGTRLTAITVRTTRVFTSSGRLVSSKPTSSVAIPLGLHTAGAGTHWTIRDGSHVYAHVYGCDDDGGPIAAISSLQAVPGTQSIVYASYCAEPFDNLYALNANGTGLRRLTNVQAQETSPRISPDRTQIAFEWADATGLSCKGCATSIRTLHLDGSPGATLTTPPDCTFDASPSWSPDGTDIAYSHSSCSTAPRLLTMHRDLKVEASEVAWGPSLIAYLDGGTAPSSIWTIEPDGTGATKVGWGNVTSPAWSADGRLAYLEGTKAVVGRKRIPLPFARVRSIAWSPDGTRFLVAAKPKNAPTFDLYSVKTDGTGVQRLTSNMDVSSGDWR